MRAGVPHARMPCAAAALAGALLAGALLAGADVSGAEPLVDPTRPVAARAAAYEDTSGVHVQAIVSRAGSRIAIVDGKVVHAGDRVANVVIEEVTPEGVRYSQDGRSGFARLASPKVTVRRVPVAERDVP